MLRWRMGRQVRFRMKAGALTRWVSASALPRRVFEDKVIGKTILTSGR